jgi:hypothetical protein
MSDASCSISNSGPTDSSKIELPEESQQHLLSYSDPAQNGSLANRSGQIVCLNPNSCTQKGGSLPHNSTVGSRYHTTERPLDSLLDSGIMVLRTCTGASL